MAIDTNLVYNLLKLSIELTYKKDEFLITHEPTIEKQYHTEEHVGERAILFRIAYYLQNLISENFEDEIFVDCEYNRYYNKSKEIPGKPNGTAPDLVLHKRNSIEKNIMICEFKGYWFRSNSEMQQAIKDDKVKVEKFCDLKGKFRYILGFVIHLNKEYFTIYNYDVNQKKWNAENFYIEK